MTLRDLTPTLLERPGAQVLVRRRLSTSGRWAVLCHGAGMDGRMFAAQVAAFPSDMGLCVWDARGHGESALDGPFRYDDMVADLDALITELDAEELTLVGQSMGGQLVQTLLAERPGAAQRVVIIDATDNHAPLRRRDRWALAATGPMLRVLPWGWTVRASADGCGAEPATRDFAEACLRRMGRARMAEVMASLSRALTPDPAYRLPVPALLLMGAEDRLGNIRSAMPSLAARNPGTATLHVLDGAAHNSNQDRPELTNRLIREFVGSA